MRLPPEAGPEYAIAKPSPDPTIMGQGNGERGLATSW